MGGVATAWTWGRWCWARLILEGFAGRLEGSPPGGAGVADVRSEKSGWCASHPAPGRCGAYRRSWH